MGSSKRMREHLSAVGFAFVPARVAVSTLLTLLIVPVAYTLMDDAQTAVMRWVGKERSSRARPRNRQ